MSCKELVEVITNYLEGTLHRKDRIRFDAHLGKCPWCRNYLDQMRQTVRMLGSLGPEPLAPEVRERLLEAFRDWRAAR
jgi:predicted anti-sigma-YlaC factor YlaD